MHNDDTKHNSCSRNKTSPPSTLSPPPLVMQVHGSLPPNYICCHITTIIQSGASFSHDHNARVAPLCQGRYVQQEQGSAQRSTMLSQGCEADGQSHIVSCTQTPSSCRYNPHCWISWIRHTQPVRGHPLFWFSWLQYQQVRLASCKHHTTYLRLVHPSVLFGVQNATWNQTFLEVCS